MKKLISILLTAAMLFAVTPAVLADDADAGTSPAVSADETDNTGSDTDITDFEPFELSVVRIGQSGNKTSLRFVVSLNGFPVDVEANSLVGTRIKGAVVSKTTGDTVAEIDEEITSNELGTGTTTTLVFPMVSGVNVSEASDYIYNLSLYPAERNEEATEDPGEEETEDPGETETEDPGEKATDVPGETATVNDFEPFALSVSTMGSNNKRIRLVVPAEQFPFDATGDNALYGCTISGTMTRTEELEGWPSEISFDSVMVEVSSLRTDGRINIELEITNEVSMSTIDTTSTGGFKMYTFDLTIYPATAEELTLPEGETTIFIKPADFATDMGTWTIDSDGAMKGLESGSGETAQSASTLINIPEDGTYYIWGLAIDYAESYQGKRTFKIGINGENLPNSLGNHGETGYRWQLAGSCELKRGENIVKAVDTSRYFAHLNGIMLTTSPDFAGVSAGVLNKAFEEYGAEIIERLQIDIEPAMGDKVVYNIKNRTDEPVSGGCLYAAVYNEEGALVEVKMADGISLDAKTQTGLQTINFSGLDTWEKGKVMLLADDMKPLAPACGFSFTQTDLANPDEGSDGNFGTATDMMLDYVNDKEFNARSGASNTIRKLENGEDVTVGYVGTSITHGDTWRPSTTRWLRSQYPEANITERSIAASGTNSNLGAALITPMLLEPYHPDLVFVEYVMDGGKGEWMEGIVRQIWEFDPTIDIYMVHPVHTTNYTTYENGGVNALTAVYESVAEYYDIPSLNLNYQIFDLYDQGLLTLKASKPEEGRILFSTDGIHPTADGGYIYAGAVARGILKMEQENMSEETVYHTVPENPLYEDNWSDASSTDDLELAKLEGDWFDCEVDPSSSGYGTNFEYTGGYLSLIKNMFPTMKGTKTPGSSMTIRFRGTTAGLFEVGGQYSGSYSIQIDDQEPYTFTSINVYCYRLRHQYFFIPEQEYGEHTVTITLLDDVPAVKTTLHDKYPGDDIYDRTEAYFGHILVRGEILDINEN